MITFRRVEAGAAGAACAIAATPPSIARRENVVFIPN
jgi:hypothetical protein